MCDRAFRNVVLLGLLAFALVPGPAGAGPVINLSVLSHDFGRVNVGASSASFDFIVTNSGDAPLTISSLVHSGAGFTALAPSSPITTTGVITASFTPSGSGPFSDNVTILSDATNGSVSFLLTGTGNTAPVFSPPFASAYNAPAGVLFSLAGSAIDAEGDPLTWSIASAPALPPGILNPTTGVLNWTPNCSDAGSYAVTITVSDGMASTPSTFELVVTCSNRPPTANPGGPYNGCIGVPVQFNGSGSSDPDAGQSLTYDWYFGDLQPHDSGQTPTHVFSAPGVYTVSLTVTDDGTPVLSSPSATTTATITAPLQGVIINVTPNLNLSPSSNSGKFLAIAFQPAGSWNITDWDQVLANTILTVSGYPGSATASTASIPASSGVAKFPVSSVAGIMSTFHSNSFVQISMQLEIHLKNVQGCDIVRMPFTVMVKNP